MRTVLKNCTLLDGTKDMLIQNDMDIVFENGKITEIGKVNAKKAMFAMTLTVNMLCRVLSIFTFTYLRAGSRKISR